MTVDDYVEQMRGIVGRVGVVLLVQLTPLTKTATITRTRATQTIAATYRPVAAAREEAIRLARSFYDAERAAKTDATERFDADLLPKYRAEWYADDMNAATNAVLRAIDDDTPMGAVVDQVTERALLQITDAAARQVARMVTADRLARDVAEQNGFLCPVF